MLELVRVRAFAIIEELEVHFAPGFNVLTGETGAGKSILVEALHLVLGGRAQADSVRTGAEEAEVQALFRPRDPGECDARLQRLGLPAAGTELVVRRSVQREGRSRAWVNGALATAAQLQAATRALLDISGQHEHVGLLDAALHLDLLDSHAQLAGLREDFSRAFAALSAAERARAQLDSDESQRAQRADWLKFQLDELEKAAPEAGEDERAQAGRGALGDGILHHHTRQRFSRTMGAPALHENARSNSGMFTKRPLTRYLPGECASVRARARRSSGRWCSQAHCA